MKNFHSDENGIGHLVVLLVLVVLVAVGYVGWQVVGMNKQPEAATLTTTHKSAPSTLKTKADVTKAANELDATAVDSTVNPDQLDQDLNVVL